MTVIRFTSMPDYDLLKPRSYLAADVTYNNTAALANTALSVTLEAGKKYAIKLVVHSTNVARALNMDFGGTATITNFIGQWSSYEANSNFGNPNAAQITAAGTDYSNTALDTNAGFYKFEGSVEINAAGTFLLRGAQHAADASNTVIKRGSTLVLTLMD